MFVIGGSHSTFLVDPDPLVGENAILNFDIDAHTWS